MCGSGGAGDKHEATAVIRVSHTNERKESWVRFGKTLEDSRTKHSSTESVQCRFLHASVSSCGCKERDGRRVHRDETKATPLDMPTPLISGCKDKDQECLNLLLRLENCATQVMAHQVELQLIKCPFPCAVPLTCHNASDICF